MVWNSYFLSASGKLALRSLPYLEKTGMIWKGTHKIMITMQYSCQSMTMNKQYPIDPCLRHMSIFIQNLTSYPFLE